MPKNPLCDSFKVSIVGLGRVGVTAAYALLLRGLVDELVLVSRSKAKAMGEKLDLEQGLPFLDSAKVVATEDYADIAGSDVVIITAGEAQKPGESRLDLLQKNRAIMREITPQIVEHASDAVIVVVTNPVDVLTYEVTQAAQLPPGRVLGSGTMLDTARFRSYLSEYLHIHPRSIHAYILGEHGDSAFPVVELATVGGQLLSEFPHYSSEKMQDAFEKVRSAAYKIIEAKGATYYAIGVVISQLVRTILHDDRSVLPVSRVIHDYYGESGVSVSVPCIVGRGGAEHALHIQLSAKEQRQFSRSCQILRQALKD